MQNWRTVKLLEISFGAQWTIFIGVCLLPTMETQRWLLLNGYPWRTIFITNIVIKTTNSQGLYTKDWQPIRWQIFLECKHWSIMICHLEVRLTTVRWKWGSNIAEKNLLAVLVLLVTCTELQYLSWLLLIEGIVKSTEHQHWWTLQQVSPVHLYNYKYMSVYIHTCI